MSYSSEDNSYSCEEEGSSSFGAEVEINEDKLFKPISASEAAKNSKESGKAQKRACEEEEIERLMIYLRRLMR